MDFYKIRDAVSDLLYNYDYVGKDYLKWGNNKNKHATCQLMDIQC